MPYRKRPKRISMGCYAVTVDGREVIIQRLVGRGFRIIALQGKTAPIFSRLYLAVAAAIEGCAAEPWPFAVPAPGKAVPAVKGTPAIAGRMFTRSRGRTELYWRRSILGGQQ